jgi:hypothetical protein
MNQLSQSRKSLEQEKRKIAGIKETIKKRTGISTRLTRTQLGKQTPLSLTKRKVRMQKGREALKSVQAYEKKELIPWEKGIKEMEKRQGVIGGEQAEWKLAKKLISKGKESAARGDPRIMSKIKKMKQFQRDVFSSQKARGERMVRMGEIKSFTLLDPSGREIVFGEGGRQIKGLSSLNNQPKNTSINPFVPQIKDNLFYKKNKNNMSVRGFI